MSLIAVNKIRENVFYDERTGNIYYDAAEDITDILNDNLVAQADPNNGWTPDRMFRQTGNIPKCVYHQWAKRTGHYQMDGEQKKKNMEKFLKEYQQYATVDRLKHDTANQGHIIIK
jgi:hypothetical protein